MPSTGPQTFWTSYSASQEELPLMSSYRKLWIALAIVVTVSFAVLGGVGYKALHSAPPIPAQVVTPDGQMLFTGTSIRDGQNVWQSIGGQEVGSIWGHGSYVAPDWTADYLHRECMYILNRWAKESGAANYGSLSIEQQAALQARLQQMMRTNTYNATSNTITIDPLRLDAYRELAGYYGDVFGKGRSAYAIPAGALTNVAKQQQMA